MSKTLTLENVRLGYENWHQSSQGKSDTSQLEAPWYEWARKQLSGLGGQRLLEIACGRGALVNWAAKQGAHAVGCDISMFALRDARNSFGGNYLSADIHEMSFPAATFDVVVCCETLEHTLDPGMALVELHRVTKPGGKLLLTTPSYLNTYGLYRLYLKSQGRPFGTHGIQPVDRCFFSPLLLHKIRKAGWRVCYTDGLVHYFRPAQDRLMFLERNAILRNAFKYFALHFAVAAMRPE